MEIVISDAEEYYNDIVISIRFFYIYNKNPRMEINII